MPMYLIRSDEWIPKYARIDERGKKVVWDTQESATGYATPELAMEAFEKACSAMAESATKSMQKGLAEGRIVVDGWKKYTLKSALESYEKGGPKNRARHNPIDLFVPEWLSLKMSGKARFQVSSRAMPDDLLSVFESFYVRQRDKWLGRSERKNESGLMWTPSFSLATAFTSREAASAELALSSGHGYIVKATSVFTEVQVVGKPASDGVCSAIGSACEARDIEQVVNEVAHARLEKMRDKPGAVGVEPKPKTARPRL